MVSSNSKDKVKYSVVTPVWNQSGLTARLLGMLAGKHKDLSVEYIIVDNGSTDDTKHVVTSFMANHPEMVFKYIKLDSNFGFGPGNNVGVANSSGEIIVLISNDVFVSMDFLPAIEQAIGGSNKVIVGPDLIERSGWAFFRPIGFVPYLAGWCLGMTRAAWNEIGGFDPRFVPCDYEDVDFSYTATKKGMRLKAVYLPLRHFMGKTADTLPEGRLKYTNENRAKFAQKWKVEIPVR